MSKKNLPRVKRFRRILSQGYYSEEELKTGGQEERRKWRKDYRQVKIGAGNILKG